MKQMWDIADRGDKHDDPVSGPSPIQIRCLEEAGRTVRRDELIREAQTLPKFSRAGATPVYAAVEPPQTRFVPIVTSGVAPALEELPSVMHSSSDENLEALIETQ